MKLYANVKHFVLTSKHFVIIFITIILMADFEVNRRLKKIITEVYKISAHKFSSRYNDKGGVKTSQVLRERNGLSNNLLDEILSAYPEINRTWLLTGVGEMMKNRFSQLSEQTNSYEKKNYSKEDILGQLIETNSMLVTTNSKLVDQHEKIITALKEITATNVELAKKINSSENKSENLIDGAAKTA